MGMCVIRRNNYMLFVNGGISTFMKTGQPHLIDTHEAVHSLKPAQYL